MQRVNNGKQVSITINYDEISDAAGSATDECDSAFDTFGFFTMNGMVQIDEGTLEHFGIEKSLLCGMGPIANDTKIVAIHRNKSSTLTGKAWLDSFNIFANAVAKKCGGDANVRYAWYGTSRDDINKILCHGFSRCDSGAGKIDEMNGFGVQLSHISSSIDGVLSSEVDEKGLRHILLCRVILGKMEVVHPGSKQFHPSSEEFDSGVDNLEAPSKYIVWSCYMNSHIFLDYIISFKVVFFHANAIRPNSSWIGFPNIIAILSRFLPPSKMDLIVKYYRDCQNRKIMEQQFLTNLVQVAGKKLFTAVIKLYKNELPMGRPYTGSSSSSSSSSSGV